MTRMVRHGLGSIVALASLGMALGACGGDDPSRADEVFEDAVEHDAVDDAAATDTASPDVSGDAVDTREADTRDPAHDAAEDTLPDDDGASPDADAAAGDAVDPDAAELDAADAVDPDAAEPDTADATELDAADAADDGIAADVGADAADPDAADGADPDVADVADADVADADLVDVGPDASDAVDQDTAPDAGDAVDQDTAPDAADPDVGPDAGDTAPPTCDPGYAWDGAACVALDPCLVDNGGCGDPFDTNCVSQGDDAPLCVDARLADYQALTAGVATLDLTDMYFSPLVVHGEGAIPVVTLEWGHVLVAAARVRNEGGPDGRVWWGGREELINGLWNRGDDSDLLLLNAIAWASHGKASPVVGVQAGQTALHQLLTAHGLQWSVVGPAGLDGVDVFIGTSYPEWTTADVALFHAFLGRGGGIIQGGHGWTWGGTDIAVNHPGNRRVAPAGVTLLGSWVQVQGPVAVTAAPPLSVHHTARALDWLGERLDAGDLGTPAERTAALFNIRRAAENLPMTLGSFWDVVRDTVAEQHPTTPTEAAPVHRGSQPLEALLIELFTELALRDTAERVLDLPVVHDFPGPPTTEQRFSAMVGVPGVYSGLHPSHAYANAGAPRRFSTGLYAPPGELIFITVDAPDPLPTPIHLRIGAHSSDLRVGWVDAWQRFPAVSRVDVLTGGQHTVASPFGGLIYLEVPAGSALDDVMVTISNVVPAPIFVSETMTLDDWNQRRLAPAPWGELVGRRFVLTLPASVVAAIDDPRPLLDLWDEVLDANADLLGVDRERPRRERLVTDRQLSVGWMHAGYPIKAYNSYAHEIVNLERVLAEGEWGVMHELGHNHQWLDWLIPGTIEATCNLFALNAYEAVLGLHRDHDVPALEHSERKARIASYLATGPDFAQWEVWVALETFLQLQEAFGWEALRDIFLQYHDLSPAERPSDDQARIDQWVERSANQVGFNLGPFYQAWGWPVSAGTLANVAALPHWSCDPMDPASSAGTYAGTASFTVTSPGLGSDTCTGDLTLEVAVDQSLSGSGPCTFHGVLADQVGTITVTIDGTLDRPRASGGVHPGQGLPSGMWSGTLTCDGHHTLTASTSYSGTLSVGGFPVPITVTGGFSATQE